MRKLDSFVWNIRAKALLCCCAPVVLTVQSGAAVAASDVADLATTAAIAGETTALDPRNFTLVGYAQKPQVATFNYYVSTTGDDTAVGSQAAPFKTLARAIRAATTPGTTVWVAPGIYEGGVKTTASGTASSRIYYVSTTKWGAKIVPPAISSNSTAWDNRGDYVSIIGFDIDGSRAGTGTEWLRGIYSGGSYDIFEGNHVQHIARRAACTPSGGAGIHVDHYFKGIQGDIIGNRVHHIGPWGDPENVRKGCKYIHGIYMSTSGSIKNNVVYRADYAAIHLWHDAYNVIITNNTLASSTYGIIVGGGDYYHRTGGATDVYVYSNIVYDNYYGVSEQGKTGSNNNYLNNLVFQNPGYNWFLQNGLTHANTVTSDPLLVGFSRTSDTPDFRLTARSPAVGRGTATYAYPVDIDGRARNASTGYDIGAYQH